MNRNVTIAVIVVIVLALGAFVLARNTTQAPVDERTPENTVSNNEQATTTAEQPTTTVKTFTMAEVATHNTETSCYSVVRGEVYDLTAWIAKHPGGPDKIKNICGKDGTPNFERVHDGKQPQENTLAGFKIGVLAQ